MTAEITTPRSRRAILGAGLGAVAATVATALARPLPVAADDDTDIMQVGGTYLDAQTQTTLSNKANNNTVLYVTSFPSLGHGGGTAVYGGSGSGIGVEGDSDSANGVYGHSVSGYGVIGNSDSGYGVVGGSNGSGNGVLGASNGSGTGVEGDSDSGTGVFGDSGSHIGVSGVSGASNKPAVLGFSQGASTGVQGFSGAPGPLPATPPKTGVYGYAAQDASARGVTGQSTAGYGISGVASTGRGVNGTATTGYGLFGAASSGIGARGWSTTGTALYATTSGPKIGTALRAIGRVKFDNCAGVATIAAGHNSVVVTPGSDMLATSAVVATLQGNPSGVAMVKSVSVDATADTFTIYLTANATAAVTVAWHAFG